MIWFFIFWITFLICCIISSTTLASSSVSTIIHSRINCRIILNDVLYVPEYPNNEADEFHACLPIINITTYTVQSHMYRFQHGLLPTDIKEEIIRKGYQSKHVHFSVINMILDKSNAKIIPAITNDTSIISFELLPDHTDGNAIPTTTILDQSIVNVYSNNNYNYPQQQQHQQQQQQQYHEQRHLQLRSKTLRVMVVRIVALDTEPTTSLDELYDLVFSMNQYNASVQYQMLACSAGQLYLQPALNIGVMDININLNANDIKATNGDSSEIRNIILNAAYDAAPNAIQSLSTSASTSSRIVSDIDLNNIDDIRDITDLIMMIIPPVIADKNWAAFGTVNGAASVYNDVWITYLGASMHEIGHNIGLYHSNYKNIEYNDVTGYMGSAPREQYFPRKCYNAQNHYSLKWFDDKTLYINTNNIIPKLYKLATFVDYYKISNINNLDIDIDDYYVIITINEQYFMQYNRAKLHNNETNEYKDMLIIVENEVKGTERVAELDVGDVYVLPSSSLQSDSSNINYNLYLIVCNNGKDVRDDGVVDFMLLSIGTNLLDTKNACEPSKAPIEPPTPSPTPLPTSLPTKLPTRLPTPSPTESPITLSPTRSPDDDNTIEETDAPTASTLVVETSEPTFMIVYSTSDPTTTVPTSTIILDTSSPTSDPTPLPFNPLFRSPIMITVPASVPSSIPTSVPTPKPVNPLFRLPTMITKPTVIIPTTPIQRPSPIHTTIYDVTATPTLIIHDGDHNQNSTGNFTALEGNAVDSNYVDQRSIPIFITMALIGSLLVGCICYIFCYRRHCRHKNKSRSFILSELQPNHGFFRYGGTFVSKEESNDDDNEDDDDVEKKGSGDGNDTVISSSSSSASGKNVIPKTNYKNTFNPLEATDSLLDNICFSGEDLSSNISSTIPQNNSWSSYLLRNNQDSTQQSQPIAKEGMQHFQSVTDRINAIMAESGISMTATPESSIHDRLSPPTSPLRSLSPMSDYTVTSPLRNSEQSTQAINNTPSITNSNNLLLDETDSLLDTICLSGEQTTSSTRSSTRPHHKTWSSYLVPNSKDLKQFHKGMQPSPGQIVVSTQPDDEESKEASNHSPSVTNPNKEMIEDHLLRNNGSTLYFLLMKHRANLHRLAQEEQRQNLTEQTKQQQKHQQKEIQKQQGKQYKKQRQQELQEQEQYQSLTQPPKQFQQESHHGNYTDMNWRKKIMKPHAEDESFDGTIMKVIGPAKKEGKR